MEINNLTLPYSLKVRIIVMYPLTIILKPGSKSELEIIICIDLYFTALYCVYYTLFCFLSNINNFCFKSKKFNIPWRAIFLDSTFSTSELIGN